MNIHVKTSIILLFTFLIGGLVGFLAADFFHHPRPMPPERGDFPPVERLRQMDGFQFFMEDLLKPTEEQRDQFREILTKHHEKLQGIRTKQREEMIATLDSLHTDLEKILTPEQLNTLNKRRKFMRMNQPGEPGPMGPGPFMGKENRRRFGHPDSLRMQRLKNRRQNFE